MARLFDVFLSSTHEDLQLERHDLTHALLRTEFRPVQMEAFPSSVHRADRLITDLVRRSDFLVLIVAGRYGSVIPGTDESFTEREYRTAVESGMPILVFFKSLEPQEMEPRMQQFREQLKAAHVCQSWVDSGELSRLVTQSLSFAVEDNRTAGWIRADGLGAEPLKTLADVTMPAASLGIRRVSPDGIAGPEMGERLSGAQRIRIMSTTGVRLVEAQRHSLVKALRGGGELTVLVGAEDSPFLQEVEEMEGRESATDSLAVEIKRLRVRLLEIAREADASGGHSHITLGFMSTQLRVTVTIADDWGWMSLTLPPLRTPETVSLELDSSADDSLLDGLARHYDRVWEIVASRGAVETVCNGC